MLSSCMDSFDIKLLAALQEDGRLTNYELAERVGLSASQCSRRRVALEASGVIESYHAHLAPAALGLGIMVFVLIAGLEEVQEAYALTGAADYQLKLIVPDLAALAHILNDVFLPHESVQHVHSSVVLTRLKQTSMLPLGHLSSAMAAG
jgi:DNA-binding Lrp family transcriptional regulator